MKEALTYLFKDNKWCAKAGALVVFNALIAYAKCFGINPRPSSGELGISVLGCIALGIIIAVVNCIISGYKISNIRALYAANSNFVIPFMNLKNNFVQGFKYYLAYFAFVAPCMAIFMILAFVLGLLSHINFIAFKILLIVSTVLVIAYFIYMLLFSMGFINMYAREAKYSVYYNIKGLINNIKKAPKQYFKNLGFSIVAYTTSLIMLVVLTMFMKHSNLSIFVNIACTAIVLTYLFFILNMFCAKCLVDTEE